MKTYTITFRGGNTFTVEAERFYRDGDFISFGATSAVLAIVNAWEVQSIAICDATGFSATDD